MVRELFKLESAVTLQALTVVLPNSPLAGEELRACADVVSVAAPRALGLFELHALELDTSWNADEDRWFRGPTDEEWVGQLQVRQSSSVLG